MSGWCESVWEGNDGPTTMACWVDLSAPSTDTVVVEYMTEGGTAVPDVDYLPVRGTLTFPPGTTHAAANLTIVGDNQPEGTESVALRLSTSAGVALGEPMTGYIVNDDPLPFGADLSNGFVYNGDLSSHDGDRHVDFFNLLMTHPASYEAVVDAASGDALPIQLEIPGAVPPQHGTPVGAGPAQSLRFDTSPYGFPPLLPLLVYSGGCGGDCGPEDTYRFRFYETTLSGGRINNAGTMRTVLILQNPDVAEVHGVIHFWSEDGSYVAGRPFALSAHASLALDTTGPMPAGSGSVTVTHDAPYGVLRGKAISFDTENGFSSDSFLQPKPL